MGVVIEASTERTMAFRQHRLHDRLRAMEDALEVDVPRVHVGARPLSEGWETEHPARLRRAGKA